VRLKTATEYRPNRNYVHLGDPVQCRPRVGWPFPAVVVRVRVDDNGVCQEVDVYGAPRGRPPATRTFHPSRITRKAVSRKAVSRAR